MRHLIGGAGLLLGSGLALGLFLIDAHPILCALAACGVWTAAGMTADLFKRDHAAGRNEVPSRAESEADNSGRMF